MKNELRQIVNRYLEEHDVRALNIRIEKEEQPLFEMLWGKTAEQGKEIDASTLFTIGSVSKMFTAVAVLILKDQGKLELDQPVYKLLDKFEMADERYRQITVRMLLNHSSGLGGNASRGKYTLSANREYLDQVLAFMRESVLKDEPGKFSVYCNDGFALAEALIEAVSKMSYADFIEENILIPLNMQNTCFPDHEVREGRIVYAKSPFQTDYPQEYVNGIGSGGIYSTAYDLCLFMNALKNHQLLKPDSYAEMMRLQVPGKMKIEQACGGEYGLGWDTVKLDTLAFYGLQAAAKAGSTYGFGAYVLLCEEANLTAAIVMSSVDGNPPLLLKKLVNEVMQQLGAQPKGVSFSPLIGKTQQIDGIYGDNSHLISVQAKEDGLILQEMLRDQSWIMKKEADHYYSDQPFYGKENPALYFAAEGDDLYLIVESDHPSVMGLRQRQIFLERLKQEKKRQTLSLTEETFLMENEFPAQRCLGYLPMKLTVVQQEGWVLAPYPLRILSDKLAVPALEIPGNNSREMYPLQIHADGSFSLGQYHYIPLAQIPVLSSLEFEIEKDKTRWFKCTNALDSIRMDGDGRCVLIDQAGTVVYDSALSWNMPEDLDGLWIGFMGREKTKIQIEANRKEADR